MFSLAAEVRWRPRAPSAGGVPYGAARVLVQTREPRSAACGCPQAAAL